MAEGLILGVDGGNTKTAAVLAGTDGALMGRGTAGCSDIYGAASPDAAVQELDAAITGACEAAGTSRSQIQSTALCLAGADWPEDLVFLEHAARRLGIPGRVSVFNDAFGPLRAGSPDFTGVSVVCGTGAATGARSGEGLLWHASWWQQPQGARHLGQKALQAVYRAALGIAPPTALTERILASYFAGSVEQVLHSATQRNHKPFNSEPAALALTEAAESGDAVATEILQAHGFELAAYALAAVRRVGLSGTPLRLILAGSVMTASDALRSATVEAFVHAEPATCPVVPAEPPEAGALLLAFDQAGLQPSRATWLW